MAGKGRNQEKCRTYRAQGRCDRNAAVKLAKHCASFPEDAQAQQALAGTPFVPNYTFNRKKAEIRLNGGAFEVVRA